MFAIKDSRVISEPQDHVFLVNEAVSHQQGHGFDSKGLKSCVDVDLAGGG